MVHMVAHGQGSVEARLAISLAHLLHIASHLLRQSSILGGYLPEEGPVASVKRTRLAAVEGLKQMEVARLSAQMGQGGLILLPAPAHGVRGVAPGEVEEAGEEREALIGRPPGKDGGHQDPFPAQALFGYQPPTGENHVVQMGR
jgi:hypothetical protein